MVYGYIFKIPDLNITPSNSHQWQNALRRFRKRYPKSNGFITDEHGEYFSITDLYETTTHTDSYRQDALHKLFAIKIFDKNPDNATIGVVFNKFIATLLKQKHVNRTLEALDGRTCLTLIISIINPVADLLRKI